MAEVSPKKSSLKVSAAWIMSARTAAFVLSFTLPLLLVRRLDQEAFGQYKQVFLIAITALNVLPLGFHMSAFYFLPREAGRQGAVVFNILLFHLLVGGAACLAFVLRPTLIASLFPGSEELVAYAPALGLLLLLWIVSSFLETVAMANQEAKMATLFIVSMQLARTSLLLLAAIAFASVPALIYAAIIQGVLQTIVLLFYLSWRFEGFGRRFDWPLMRAQLSYGLPLGAAGFLYSMQLDLHNYFVSNRFGAATYAIYAIGCFQLPLVGILTESVGSVMIPRVSHLEKQGENRQIVMLAANVMRKLAFIFFPLYVFLMITGRELLTVLFTEQYRDSWPIFAVNLTLLPFAILIVDPIQRAYAEERYFLLKLHAVLVVLMAAALLIWGRHLSLVGIISIVVAVNVIGRAVTAINLGRVVGLTKRDIVLLKDVGKVALAAIAAGAVTVFLRFYLAGTRPFIVLGLCGLAFLLAYCAAIAALNILTLEERLSFRQRFNQLLGRNPSDAPRDDAADSDRQGLNMRRKLATAGRVFKSQGPKGVASVVAEKISMWWRRGDRWEVGRLVGAGSKVVRLDGCVFATDSPAISDLVKSLLLQGSYEKPERVALKRFLDPQLPVVELGACLGVVACLTNKRLNDPKRHVVVEANPDLLPLIEENRRRNDCHFTVLHRAVGYGGREITFYLSDDAIVSSLNRPTTRAVSVPSVGLKDILDQFGFRRSTLICDIEGAELEVVRREADVLSTRVSTIIIEVHDRLVGDGPTKDMLDELERIGFRPVYKDWDTYVLENGNTGAL